MHPNLMKFDTKPAAPKPQPKKEKPASAFSKPKPVLANFLFAATRTIAR